MADSYVADTGHSFEVVINGEVRNEAPYTPGDQASKDAAQGYAEQSFNALSGQASWSEQSRAPEADWWQTGGLGTPPREIVPAPELTTAPAPSYQPTATPAGWREYPELQPDGSIEIWATDDAGNWKYVRTVQGPTAGGGTAPTTGYPTTGTPTGYPTGGTYNTRDGPLPEAELRRRLQDAGYNGPWDAASMVAAYNRAPLGAGGGGGAGSSNIYSPVNDLAYKYAELAFWRERLERLELPQLEADKIRDSMTAALQYTAQMGYMIEPRAFSQYMQGTGAFPTGTVPTLEREQFQWSQQQELAKLMANPATLVQGLAALGNTPEQISSFLQQSPMYQQLIPDYMRQYYQPRAGYGVYPQPGENIGQPLWPKPVAGPYDPTAPIGIPPDISPPPGLPYGGAGAQMPAGQGGYEGGLLGGGLTPAPSTGLSQTLYWPDAGRGLNQPGGMYAQVMTPVNMNDPAEVARYQQMYGGAPGAPTSPPNWVSPLPPSQNPEDYIPRYLLPEPPQTGTQQPFQFPQGYQLPVRQTLWDIQNQSPKTGLISSMMGFAGMNPESEWAKFYTALPKGQVAAPARYF